jgi:hypothetical protein
VTCAHPSLRSPSSSTSLTHPISVTAPVAAFRASTTTAFESPAVAKTVRPSEVMARSVGDVSWWPRVHEPRGGASSSRQPRWVRLPVAGSRTNVSTELLSYAAAYTFFPSGATRIE